MGKYRISLMYEIDVNIPGVHKGKIGENVLEQLSEDDLKRIQNCIKENFYLSDLTSSITAVTHIERCAKKDAETIKKDCDKWFYNKIVNEPWYFGNGGIKKLHNLLEIIDQTNDGAIFDCADEIGITSNDDVYIVSEALSKIVANYIEENYSNRFLENCN